MITTYLRAYFALKINQKGEVFMLLDVIIALLSVGVALLTLYKNLK